MSPDDWKIWNRVTSTVSRLGSRARDHGEFEQEPTPPNHLFHFSPRNNWSTTHRETKPSGAILLRFEGNARAMYRDFTELRLSGVLNGD